MTAEVEVMDWGSQGGGSVTHVGTEALQNYHQSRLGESCGESEIEASRNGAGGQGGRERWREVGLRSCLQVEKVHAVEPDGLKFRAGGFQERRELLDLERCRAMLGGTKCAETM